MLYNSSSCRLQIVPVVLSGSALLPCAEASASPPSPEKGALGGSGAPGIAVESRLKPEVQLGFSSGAGNCTTHCICHWKLLSDFLLLSVEFSKSTTCQ